MSEEAMLAHAARGAISLGLAVAGLFFLRFWRETRDRLFAFFAVAFFLLAVNRLGLMWFTAIEERRDQLYWVRLIAFAIILAAIWDKNRKS